MKTITTIDTNNPDLVQIEYSQDDAKETVELTWDEYETMLKETLAKPRII